MHRRFALIAGCAIALCSASCGHKAEPRYCSQQFGTDTQALLEAGQKAETHWKETNGDLQKISLDKLRPYKSQCDSYFKKYDEKSACISAMDGSKVNPVEFKQGCEFVQKAFKASQPSS